MSGSHSVPFAGRLPLLIALVVTLAAGARAQVSGVIALPDCSGVDAAAGTQGELVILFGESSIGTYPDGGALFDLRSKGGLAVEGTSLGAPGFASRGDIVRPGGVTPGVFVTLPPAAPAEAGRVVMAQATGASLGALIPQTIGDSLPVGVDRGIGLHVVTGATYAVNFGASVGQYPQRGSDGSTTIAFSPLTEGNSTRRGDACTTSGWTWGAPLEIAGYAIHRVPAPAGAPPGPDEFTAALTDGDPATGFIAFVDLRKFRFGVATDVTVDPTVNDLDLADGASLHDPEGRMYSGDEVLLWTDSPTGPRAPDPSVAYGYAVQPVAPGRIRNQAPCYTLNCVLDGDHGRDLDGDGTDDAIDLDGTSDGTGDVEIISPQADADNGGLDGLGLTYRSKLLLSATMTVPPAPTALRRSTDVTTLRPLAPPLSSFLPLTVADDHVAPFSSGDVDPDLAVIEGSAYPLVFYEVPGQDDLRLSVTGAVGARRVRFTF